MKDMRRRRRRRRREEEEEEEEEEEREAVMISLMDLINAELLVMSGY